MTDRPTHHRLLIGTPPNGAVEALADADRFDTLSEGLTAAQKNNYAVIYLVLADIPEPRQKNLDTLARIAPHAKRYLLIDMFEEPEAIRLRQTGNGRQLFTDYLLLPLPLSDSFQTAPPPAEHMPSPAAGFDIDRTDRLIAELQKLVTQDDLTGLKNRRYLRQFLPAIIENAGQKDCQVTLLLFDLDNFKHYNDTYGHSVGDAVLFQTGKLMQRCCRSHDVVARLGGDEFAVVFWDLPKDIDAGGDRRREHADHPRQAQFMAERFRREMSEADFEFLGPKGKGNLTISGGLATYPRDAKNAPDLYEKADQAMLNAKQTGKNKITIVGQPTQ
jgi:two-component system cell cycle response regulator